jgi:DNA-binding transcriptional regulator YhcF (GntR family)
MSSIEAALAAIDSLEPGEKFSYRQIANKYGCNRTTLARRHKGVTVSCGDKAQNQRALHPQQEQELLQYIKQLTERGLPPT